jgi:hypothetical protein
MKELEIFNQIRTALFNATTGVKVTEVLPNKEVHESIPLIVLNIQNGNCKRERMGDHLNIAVEATLTIDMVTYSKADTYALADIVHTVVTDTLGTYKVSLGSFNNTVDISGQKPLYIREASYEMSFQEQYNGQS